MKTNRGSHNKRAAQPVDGEDSRQGHLAGDDRAQAPVCVRLAVPSVRQTLPPQTGYRDSQSEDDRRCAQDSASA